MSRIILIIFCLFLMMNWNKFFLFLITFFIFFHLIMHFIYQNFTWLICGIFIQKYIIFLFLVDNYFYFKKFIFFWKSFIWNYFANIWPNSKNHTHFGPIGPIRRVETFFPLNFFKNFLCDNFFCKLLQIITPISEKYFSSDFAAFGQIQTF